MAAGVIISFVCGALISALGIIRLKSLIDDWYIGHVIHIGTPVIGWVLTFAVPLAVMSLFFDSPMMFSHWIFVEGYADPLEMPHFKPYAALALVLGVLLGELFRINFTHAVETAKMSDAEEYAAQRAKYGSRESHTDYFKRRQEQAWSRSSYGRRRDKQTQRQRSYVPPMDDAATHLAVLGLEGRPPHKTIKSAYRKLARQFHPDTLMSQNLSAAKLAKSEARMTQINIAYDWLCDNYA